MSRGSYAFRQVQTHFNKAFIRITSLVGLEFSRERNHNTKTRQRLSTVLGTVVAVGKTVLEHREYVETVWRELQANGWDETLVHHVVGGTGAKRKRGDESEGEFVEGESSADEEEAYKRAKYWK